MEANTTQHHWRSDWVNLIAGGADGEAGLARQPKASWTVSPSELREALSGLGKAAIKFELSEMHDAAEVSDLYIAISPVLSSRQGKERCCAGPYNK